MKQEHLLAQLKAAQALLASAIHELEGERSPVTTTVKEVRRLAVLEEIFRAGRGVTPQEISAIALRYGKDPSSTAGYYSGQTPSLAASIDRKTRLLTPAGEKYVVQAREAWGNDWLDRLPMDLIGNASTPDTEISF